MKLEFHPDTVADLNEAVDFYERESAGLGSELRQEIYRTIDRIVEDPHLYRVIRGEIRRCLAHRFPFSVLFRLVSDQTVRATRIRFVA